MSSPINSTHRVGYDPVAMMDAIQKTLGFSHAFDPKKWVDAAAVRRWQRRTRAAVARCIGFQDLPAVSFKPRVEHQVDRGEYIRRKVVIRTSAHSEMPVYLLIPKGLKRGESRPTVLAFHGHTYSVKDIVGLWEDGSERFEPTSEQGYQKDFGCELAKRGFFVAASEISCFGERRTLADQANPLAPAWSCEQASHYATMLGQSLIGLRVMEGKRLIDYLVKHEKQADTDRLAAMGISGGGMHTFFSMALDERIKVGVISGYFCDWRHSTLALPHCSCNFAPGLYRLGELSDLAGMLAPRPCLIEAATRDHLFPIDRVKRAVTKSRRAWKVFGAGDQLKTDYFEGRHEISGRLAYDFLAEQLV